jgi:phytoene dehydrogenase-like protein
MAEHFDAVVVGGGPNGLSAAVELALAGLAVCVLEAKDSVGGGARSMQLTDPGFLHDVCSAIHPVGVVSPFFKRIGLDARGVEWVYPPVHVAHPLDDGHAAALLTSLDATSAALGVDGVAWADMMRPFVERADDVFAEILKPIRIPRKPFLMARFGLLGLRSCESVARGRFQTDAVRARFAGCAAHSVLPLDAPATASFGLVLALAAHAVGWPCARGGSESIVRALARTLVELGGQIRTSHPVRSMRDLPESRVVLFDVTPRQLDAIAGDALPAGYRARLRRFRYGPGVFKVDWALDGPIPWTAEPCARSATVHVGGTLEEIAAAEAAAWRGEHVDRPFVLVAQQSLFDRTRAPEGKQTGWAYCHVPHGSDVDMTDRIEAQIERFAPGFRDRILARHTIAASRYERHNENMVGGDVGGGANDLSQFLARPFAQWDPYATPNPRLFICSSSTPPGGGVHGMCGFWSARSALRSIGASPGEPAS